MIGPLDCVSASQLDLAITVPRAVTPGAPFLQLIVRKLRLHGDTKPSLAVLSFNHPEDCIVFWYSSNDYGRLEGFMRQLESFGPADWRKMLLLHGRIIAVQEGVEDIHQLLSLDSKSIFV